MPLTIVMDEPPVTTDEQSINANGGTEMMKKGLYKRLPDDLKDKFQIICSRVRDVSQTKPSILWLHDRWNDPENNHLADPELRKRFEILVFVSYYQQQAYQLAYGIKNDECIVLKNAIVPLPRKDKPEDGITRLIYHTTPHRGLELLVPVFEYLAETDKNLVLDVYSSFEAYGWKERDKPYEELFERCRQHPQINYHGYQPNDVVREALQKADIFAYPNIWEETSCIAAIEAMSARCSIVCPAYGALPETTGMMATIYRYHDDRQKHAQQFLTSLKWTIDQTRKGENKPLLDMAKIYADGLYSWDSRIEEWVSLLRQIEKGQQ
jgi:glycosyltransferase involved in cell wall biosynthesis